MTQDYSEKLDEYCEENYGHTNWGYLDTYTKEQLENAKHSIENNIVFWHDPVDEQDDGEDVELTTTKGANTMTIKKEANTMMKKIYFSKTMHYDGYITAQNEDDAYEKVKNIDFEKISFNELKELDVKISDNGGGDSVHVEDEDGEDVELTAEKGAN